MSRFDLDREELAGLLDKEPAYRVDQLAHALYRELKEPGEVTTLPASLRQRLAGAKELELALRLVATSEADDAKTVKWLFEAGDGARVETVLMAYPRRATVCVSSQAGCAMGCTFCATGQLGFARHLSRGEIVEQVARAVAEAAARGFPRLSNVVFMGMGEPLANYGPVLGAVRRLNGDLGIGARAMTISTVGIVPGIRRLAGEGMQVNLAVSLHAGNDALRDRLVPINRRYRLAELVAACREYRQATGRRISFEWALISEVNDRPSDADELAELAAEVGAHVNLIPLNPTPGYGVPGSPPEAVSRFVQHLEAAGTNVTVRDTRGRESAAACGQLAAGLVPGRLGRGLAVASA